MGIYNKAGTSISSAYSKGGSILSAAYAVDGTALTPAPSPTPSTTFLSTAIITALPAVSQGGGKQGACTDGEYIYQFVTSAPSLFKGLKYKISDGTYTVTTLQSGIDFSHGNDMAYNPNNGHIYIAAMSSDGAVMELDTDWNYIKTYYLERPNGETYPVWGLCYDRKTRHFISDYDTRVYVYDEQFQYLGLILAARTGTWTAQGMETDGDYIYRVWYNSNRIEATAMTGEFVKMIVNPMTGEPETMMYDWTNDRFFMSKNSSSDVFYQVQIKQQ